MSEQAWKEAFRRLGGCTSCALGLPEPCTDCLGTGWAYGVPAEVLEAQAENERLREALKVAEQALSNWYEYDVQGKGTWDGKSERRALTTALRTVSAALSNTDGGEG